MTYIENLVIIENLISLLLLIIIFFMYVTQRERLLQSNARTSFRENKWLMKITVGFGLLSLFFYILGEFSLVVIDLGYLSSDYRDYHEIFELIHLGLIMLSLIIGAYLIRDAVGKD